MFVYKFNILEALKEALKDKVNDVVIKSVVNVLFLYYKWISPASTIFCRLIRIPSFA